MHPSLRVLRCSNLIVVLAVPAASLFGADVRPTGLTTLAGAPLSVGQPLAPGQPVIFKANVDGAAYLITAVGDRLTVAPVAGGPVVGFTAGQISVSTREGGAPGPAAAVMGDPALAQVVSQAASIAFAAAWATNRPSVGDLLAVMWRSSPSVAAAAVETVAGWQPNQAPNLAWVAITAAIASGQSPAEAGRTQAMALARGVMAGNPDLAQPLVKAVAYMAAMTVAERSKASASAEEIFTAVTRGALAGALQALLKPATAGGPPRPVDEGLLTAAAVGAMSALLAPGSPPPVWFAPTFEQVLKDAFADAGPLAGFATGNVNFERVVDKAARDVLAGSAVGSAAQASGPQEPGRPATAPQVPDAAFVPATPQMPLDAFPISQSGG